MTEILIPAPDLVRVLLEKAAIEGCADPELVPFPQLSIGSQGMPLMPWQSAIPDGLSRWRATWFMGRQEYFTHGWVRWPDVTGAVALPLIRPMGVFPTDHVSLLVRIQ